jgi:hypothetical protein
VGRTRRRRRDRAPGRRGVVRPAGHRQAAVGHIHRQVEGGACGRAGDEQDRVGAATGRIGVEMQSLRIRPCEVFGNRDRVIGPASWVAALHVLPPFTDGMNPASSWQVEAVQEAVG